MTTLFVSHSRKRPAETEQLRGWLQAEGYTSLFVDFDPEQGIRAGRRWERELYRQLRRCDGVVFLAGPESVASQWCFAEVSLARSRDMPVFPVRLVPGVQLSILEDVQWVDLAEGEVALAKLRAGLLSAGLNPADAFPWDPDRSAFPGLAPFEAEDAAVFFGRTEEIGRLQELMRPTLQHGGRFVVIVGPSGSGKSSLMRAGVVPRLARQPGWVVLPPLRPDTNPTRRLADCFAAAFAARDRPQPAERLLARLERGADQMVELAVELAELGADPGQPRRRVLIQIDQLEELQTTTGPREQRAFQDLLSASLKRDDSPIWALGTIRAEFLSTDPDRAGLSIAIDNAMVLEPVDRSRLAEVIARPAHRAGLDFEPGLVERITQDVAGGDALPLLAYTLKELSARATPDHVLTSESYAAIGGVFGALRDGADHARTELARRGLAELVIPTLLKLTTVENQGAPSRRALPRAGLSQDERAVVDEFVAARLIMSGRTGSAAGDRPGTGDLVEVAHEALFRQWEPLRTAIDAARDWLQRRTELERLAADWVEGGEDDSFLLRGSRLAAFEEWANARPEDVSALSRRFLAASRGLVARELETTRRSNRRLRGLAVGLAVLMVISLVAALAAWQQNGVARAQTRLAVARQLAADADRLADTDPNAAILAGLHSLATASEDAVGPPPPGLVTALARVIYPTRLLHTHDGQAHTVALGPDGHLLASVGGDGLVRLWDLAANAPAKVGPLRHGGELLGLAASPDGRLLASGGADGSVRIWDLSTGAQVGELVHGARVWSVAFSADGRLLASGGDDGTVQLWHVIDGTPSGEPLSNPDGAVFALSISVNGIVAAAGEGGTVRMWEAASGRPRGELPNADDIFAVAFSPAGDVVAAGGAEQVIRLWRVDSGEPYGDRLAGHKGVIRGIAFSPDGTRLASSSADRTVDVWSTASGQPEGAALVGSTQELDGLAFGPDGQTVVTASWSGAVQLWSLAARPSVSRALAGHTAEVQGLAYRPDGGQLATASVDSTVRRWDAHSGVQIGPPLRHNAEVNAVAYSPDGRLLASAAEDGALMLWNAESGAPVLGPVSTGDVAIRGIAFSSDGQRLALGLADGTVQVRDARSGELRVSSAFAHLTDVYSVAFNPAGTLLASGSTDGTVRIWDAETGAAASRTPIFHLGPVYTVDFSPDGATLAVGGEDRAVRLWAVAIDPPQLQQTLIGHTGRVLGVRFRPDGRLIATASADRTARLWDPENGEPVGFVLGGHTDQVSAVSFSPDGRTLATASFDWDARLWDYGFADWSTAGCQVVGRNMSSDEWNARQPGRPYERTCPDLPPGPGA